MYNNFKRMLLALAKVQFSILLKSLLTIIIWESLAAYKNISPFLIYQGYSYEFFRAGEENRNHYKIHDVIIVVH